MKRVLFFVLTAIICILALAACSTGGEGSTGETSSGTYAGLGGDNDGGVNDGFGGDDHSSEQPTEQPTESVRIASVDELEEMHGDKLYALINAQSKSALERLGMPEDASVEAKAIGNSIGITSFELTIVIKGKQYTAGVFYTTPIEYAHIAGADARNILDTYEIYDAVAHSSIATDGSFIKSVEELLEKHGDKAEEFFTDCFNEILERYEIEPRDAVLSLQELEQGNNGEICVRLEFIYTDAHGHRTTSKATLETTVDIMDIVDGSTREAIESGRVSKQDELHTVTSFDKIEEEYLEELSRFIDAQIKSACAEYDIDTTEAAEPDVQVLHDENGVTGMVIMLEDEGKTLHTFEVNYEEAISFSDIANYYHDQTKANLDNAIASSSSTYEATLNLSDEEILANYQEQINANLFNGVEACAKSYAKGLRLEYDVNNIEGYQWYLDIKEGRVQNLSLNYCYNDQREGAYSLVYEVSLENPTLLSELAKENNPAIFNKIDITNKTNSYSYLISDQSEYGDFVDIITQKLAQQDPSFDYANAKASVNNITIGYGTGMTIYYEKSNIVREIRVSTKGDATSTTQHLLESIRKNLENDKFTWSVEEEHVINGSSLDYVDCSLQAENSK